MNFTCNLGVCSARCLLCLFVAIVSSSGVAAQTATQAALPAATRTQIENTVSKFMATRSAPGIAVGVVMGGEEVWSEGFGMADLENGVPVTPQTLFRLASISKPITAVAAMELWERHQLDLDVLVQKYCPAFPKKEFPISTRQLLGHLGGVRHYRSGSDDDPELGNTKHFDDPITGGLQFFANDPLVAKPGTEFHYSTQGFTVVGCAIEGASSEKYVDFVRENVFRPAGMTVTQWDDRLAVIPHRTRFYSKAKSGVVENANFMDASYKIPGGGWLSSADDMAKFEIAILSDRLMKRETRDVMWTSRPLPPRPGAEHTGYALGWGNSEIDGTADYAHDGGQQGTSTSIIVIPERNAGVVVLINMDGLDASKLATEVMKLVLGTQGKDN